MIEILLSSYMSSYALDIAVWGIAILVFLFFAGFIFYQHRQGKEIRYELDQLIKLKANNIESEFVLKAMHLATWHMDPVTRTMTIDYDFRDKSRWSAPMASGVSTFDLEHFIYPQDVEAVDKALSDFCEGRTENYHMEYRVMIHNTKNYYWEESYATVVERDVTGKPTKVVGTTMLIDDRKKLEHDLIEARNRAEESDRLKSAFIANFSHEIRTPLNAIIGFTSVLPDLPEGKERQNLLDLIHENSQNLLGIIDDVVSFSKIESGQEQVVLTNFELNQALNHHIDLFRGDLHADVQMQTAFACESLTITTDQNRFDEIIKHLLSNATKFTSQGVIEIGYNAPVNGRLRLWVRDTGKGIAKEDREKVFERFFKVDEFVPGAGLGLSICRTMAYSIGGTVTLESKLGEGSTFILNIPIQ